MKLKYLSFACLLLIPALCPADLLLNVGRSAGAGSQVAAGEGPSGPDANWQAFNGGGHETATTGNVQAYAGTGFAEAGIAGTFNVGVEFTWPDTTDLRVRQAFGRGDDASFPNFFDTWMGADSRTAVGGNGAGNATTLRLSLSGLPATTLFNLRSYHFDSDNQTGPFTTSLSGATVFDIGADTDNGTNADGLPDPLAFAYEFDLISDASGNASIDYIHNGVAPVAAQFFVISGFELDALQVIPEPSSAVLLVFGFLGLRMMRRR